MKTNTSTEEIIETLSPRCDVCSKPVKQGMWRNLVPRPSDPHELVCTMEVCAECGAEHGFCSPEEQHSLHDRVEDGTLIVNGKRILFLTF